MKKILLISTMLIALSACSVNEPPEIDELNDYWRIYIGGEYSMITKDVNISIEEHKFTYNGIDFDSMDIHGTHIVGVKHYITGDSTLTIDITLAYNSDYLFGYEKRSKWGYTHDSTYIYGERLSAKK